MPMQIPCVKPFALPVLGAVLALTMGCESNTEADSITEDASTQTPGTAPMMPILPPDVSRAVAAPDDAGRADDTNESKADAEGDSVAEAVAQPPADPTIARFVGLTAPKPPYWLEQPPKTSMRAANYVVPGSFGADAADVIVFFFGAGQGGTVEQNIARWQGQFRSDDGGLVEPEITRFQTAVGMPITVAQFTGSYMRMGAPAPTPDQTLVAAVVEAPVGSVFIQLVGPTITVLRNRMDFVNMLEGIRSEEPANDPPGVSVGNLKGVPSDWLEGPSKRGRLVALESEGSPPVLNVVRWMNTDEPLVLAELRGKVVLLDFWGTWCPPCRAAIPRMNKLHETYREQGLVIIGVCHPRQNELMESMAEERQIGYALCVDSAGATADRYKVDGYPDYYFIDRSGALRIMDCKNARIEDAIKLLLAEEPPAPPAPPTAAATDS